MNNRIGFIAPCANTSGASGSHTRVSSGKSLQKRFSFKRKKTAGKSRQATMQSGTTMAGAGGESEEKSCTELALEGEQLCRQGQWDRGIRFLEAAVRAGTTDMKTLSALYSQLGNAYFHVQDYGRALEYHRHDLSVARSMGDKLGEAKACGNIGSALKALGQFEEAIACCRLHLDIARELNDKVLESRALYNLGNVYHSRGKHVSTHPTRNSQQEVEEYVKTSLEQAARYYEANLRLVKEGGDLQAQGRTLGNLGNTFYLIGNFKKAIKYHEERLSVAQSLGDHTAMRRALSNLGNAHVFLGKYSAAIEYYQRALGVARKMCDSAFEAQSCYSLGNTYTFMQNYERAVEFHQLHLQYAIQLDDRVGESRAYWSLCNAYSSLGLHQSAMGYARKHLQLSKQLEDAEGIEMAKQCISDLTSLLELSDKFRCSTPKMKKTESSPQLNSISGRRSRNKVSRSSSNLTRLHVDQDAAPSDGGVQAHSRSHMSDSGPLPDDFFDLLSRVQGERMEDQRSSFPHGGAGGGEGEDDEEETFLDAVWRVQGSRLEEQRSPMGAGVSTPPHVMVKGEDGEEEEEQGVSDDDLIELIQKSQGSRINEQRCSHPSQLQLFQRRRTIPSEDFFNLIQHLQSTRIEDQRSPLPLLA